MALLFPIVSVIFTKPPRVMCAMWTLVLRTAGAVGLGQLAVWRVEQVHKLNQWNAFRQWGIAVCLCRCVPLLYHQAQETVILKRVLPITGLLEIGVHAQCRVEVEYKHARSAVLTFQRNL